VFRVTWIRIAEPKLLEPFDGNAKRVQTRRPTGARVCAPRRFSSTLIAAARGMPADAHMH